MDLVDTHAHLTFPEFEGDLAFVLDRAWQAGLSAIVAVGAGSGLEGNARAVELARSDGRIFATVGIHPHDAAKVSEGWREEIERLAGDERVVAIGEIGLDHHRDHSPREVQREIFREQLELARRLGKPVVLHDREAHEDLWRIIEEVGVPPRGGVFHCFSGSISFARRAVEAGFFISVTGVVTFRKVRELAEVIAALPIERLLLETDCPYLAPEPHRGKRNEPAFVVETARRVAEIKKLSLEDVARVTTLSARRLFGLPGGEPEPRIAYRIRNALYLNITNRCNLACRFCPKYRDFEVKGHFLKLSREPEEGEIVGAVGDPREFDEIVFCGYGEPTLRLETLKGVARRLKAMGARRVRLNTDGLVNLVSGRDVLPELAGLVDALSVSLNAPDAESYARHCPSKFGEAAYDAVCAFILAAKRQTSEVVATVVALPGLDLEACRRKAEELGVPLRVREYMSIG